MGQPMALFPSMDLAPKSRLSPTLSVAGQLDTNFIGLFFKVCTVKINGSHCYNQSFLTEPQDFMPQSPINRGEPAGGISWLESIMRYFIRVLQI